MHSSFKDWIRLLPLLMFVTGVFGQKAPKGFVIPSSTLSPDKHYGITVPILAEHLDKDNNAENSLVEAETGTALPRSKETQAGIV